MSADSQTRDGAIICDIRSEHGSIIIDLQSRIQIKNLTGYELDLMLLPDVDYLVSENSGMSMRLGSIETGDEIFVPIHMCNSILTIKPLRGQDEDDWWIPGITLSALKSMVSDSASTKSFHFVRGGTYQFVLYIDTTSSGISSGGSNQFILTLAPILKLENLLPIKVEYQVMPMMISGDCTDNKRSVGLSGNSFLGTLPVGQDRNIPDIFGEIDDIMLIELRLKTDYGKWSSLFRPLHQVSKSKKISQSGITRTSVSLSGRDSGSDIEVQVEVSLNVVPSRYNDCLVKLTFFASTWLINRTALPLSFKDGSTSIADEMNRFISKNDITSNFKHGQTVHVLARERLNQDEGLHPGIVFNVNPNGAYDILLEDGSMLLDISEQVLFNRADPSQEEDMTRNRSNSTKSANSSCSDRTMSYSSESDSSESDSFSRSDIDPESLSEESQAGAMDVRTSYNRAGEPKEEDVVIFTASKALSVRSVDTSWSKPFSIDTVGTKGSISLNRKVSQFSSQFISSKFKKHAYEVGVRVDFAPSRFRRTKIITFLPRYELKNSTGKYTLLVAQAKLGRSKDNAHFETTTVKICCGEKRSFYSIVENRNKSVSDDTAVGSLTVSFESSPEEGEWCWSGPFQLNEVADTAVKIKHRTSGSVRVLRVSSETLGTTIVTSFTMEHVYRIENLSSELVHYYQILEDEKGVIEGLLPNESKEFGWDEPNLPEKEIMLCFDNALTKIECQIDELNMKPKVIKLLTAGSKSDEPNNPENQKKVVVSIHVDGETKVLTVADRAVTTSMMVTHTIARNPPESEPITSAESSGSVSFQVNFSGISISLIDSFPRELILVSFDGIKFDYLLQPGGDKFYELLVDDFQIDNQLLQARLPVMVSRSRKVMMSDNPLRKKCVFHISVVQRKNNSDVLFFEYVSFLVQELDFVLEEACLLLLVRMLHDSIQAKQMYLHESLFQEDTPSPHAWARVEEGGSSIPLGDQSSEALRILLQKWLTLQTEIDASHEQNTARKLYIDCLHFHPMKANVTFQHLVENPYTLLRFEQWKGAKHAHVGNQTRNSEKKHEQSGSPDYGYSDPSAVIAFMPLVSVDIDDAQFRLNGIKLSQVLITQSKLRDTLLNHYSALTVAQVFISNVMLKFSLT